jgi:hypothetical protein
MRFHALQCFVFLILMAKGFSCILDVLNAGLGINVSQSLIKNMNFFFQLAKFYNFGTSKSWDPDPH